MFFLACAVTMLPTFPQHRNLKNKSTEVSVPATTTSIDQGLNLPAISDLLGSLVKKRRFDLN